MPSSAVHSTTEPDLPKAGKLSNHARLKQSAFLLLFLWLAGYGEETAAQGIPEPAAAINRSFLQSTRHLPGIDG